MKRLILAVSLGLTSIIASDVEDNKVLSEVDCVILEDENSIICKYIHERVDIDKNITVNWIDPKGEVSRSRQMIIPAGHGSIYDFRYIEGREKGFWKFEVVDNEQKYTTKFELK